MKVIVRASDGTALEITDEALGVEIDFEAEDPDGVYTSTEYVNIPVSFRVLREAGLDPDEVFGIDTSRFRDATALGVRVEPSSLSEVEEEPEAIEPDADDSGA